MAATHTPWERPDPPSAAELDRLLRAENMEPRWWSNGPGDRYSAHEHGYHKVLYCAAGSITFLLPGTGESFVLTPGDRLDLPPGTRHSAVVGPEGTRCVEGWRHTGAER